MPSLPQDLKFAARQLRTSPGFAVTTILTLALGIGATTAIFSLVNAVLLRPLPFPEQDRLIWAEQADIEPGVAANAYESLSYPNFFDWRAQNHIATAMACYRNSSVTLTGSGEPQQLSAAVVSAEFFRALGVHPLLGRDFLPNEERAGTHVAMLSYLLWRSSFGSARDLVGRSITLDGRSYTVAGIMPPGFVFPIVNPAPALWTTLADDAATDSPKDKPLTSQRGMNMLRVVARLRPGVTVAQSRAELSAIAGRLARQYPDDNKPYTAAIVETQLDHSVGDFRPALRLLFAAVLLVLLIACANVAGLLLARATSRRGEIALRAALGAGRAGIMRQVLVESVLLSICGGMLGVVFSTWTLAALLRFLPADFPRASQITVDGAVLAFVTVVSLATGLLFGVLPAWRMARLDPSQALREGGRSVTAGRGQHNLHYWLVIAETALGVVLLAGAGLLIRSFVRVLHVDPGFDPHHVLVANMSLRGRYESQKRVQFYNQLLPRVASLPGVQFAAAGWPLPLSRTNIGISFQIEGHFTAPADAPDAALSIVTADYFQAMRIPILAGRAFTQRDEVKSLPVIIVNERFARKYFPGQNPIGKHLKSDLGDGTLEAPMREVVGVVGDVRHEGLTADADPQYYLPFPQAVITSPALIIRAAADPTRLIGALRTQLADLDGNIPLYRVGTLEDSVYNAAAQPRFQTLLLGCFAAMALLLSAVGLYAVLSYMVAQRTAEIGVRMALGAQRADVLSLIVRRGLTLAMIGIAAGLAASVPLTRFLAGMLYGIHPLDPLTLATVTMLLLVVSAVASSLPAWRATRLDPMRTLRDS
jgi:predicted permease